MENNNIWCEYIKSECPALKEGKCPLKHINNDDPQQEFNVSYNCVEQKKVEFKV